MKIETEPRDDRQVKIVAEFEAAEFEKYKQQAARKISRETKIPGFRPGKAPYNVIHRMFGEKAIQEQAIDLLVDKEYPNILKQAEIQPSFPGSLEEVISVDPPKFAFVVPLQPTVELGDYHAIRKEYAPAGVTEEEIDDFLKRMQTSYSTAEPVERPAKDGDLVAVKVTGTLTDPGEGQEAELIHETPYQVVIGDKNISPDAWPYEGFSQQLVGLSTNEEKDIPYTYPEDNESEQLRGKNIVFHVAVQNIKELHLPEINDEFAQMIGQFEGMAQLRETLRKNMEATKRDEYDRAYFNELVDEITAGATVAYPPQMLEEEEHQVLHNVEHNLADQGMELATYLKMMKTDLDTFVENEVRPTARRRIARSLVMDELARAEDLHLEENELQAAFNETVSELQYNNELANMQKRMTQKQLTDAIAYEAAGRAMNRRMMRRLKSIATGQPEEKPEVVEEEVVEVEEAAVEAEPAEAEAVEQPGEIVEETAAVVETPAAEDSAGAEEAPSEEKPATDAPEA